MTATVRFERVGLIAVGLALLLAPPADAQPTFEDFVGQYEGDWFNDTFTSTGAARFRIEAAGDTGTLGVDLDGNVFGGFDPPEVVFTGTIGSQALAKNDDPLFGDVSCTGNPSAFQCTGNMISAFVLSGTISGGIQGGALQSNYSLTLLGQQMASGRVEAVQVPEPRAGLAALACATLLLLRRTSR